jgi:D-galactarolactone cycloisomerase
MGFATLRPPPWPAIVAIMKDLVIERVEALPCSVPMRNAVSQGLGQAVKRDTVIVKVTTSDGIAGYGESYNGRAPLAIAQTINTTLRDLFTGLRADETTRIWQRFEDRVLGGFALGYQPPAALAAEAMECVERGYRAVKLRLGDTTKLDAERTVALREALPSDVRLLADANCRYSVEDVRTMMPVLTEAGASWLEEPFPPYKDGQWQQAAGIARLPLAAGENCHTRYEFRRLIDAGAVSVIQPDLSRCGGITEALRVAALASAAGLQVCTHGCHTGLNMAASVHYLASIDNAYYFEGDGSTDNPLRTRACSASYDLAPDGTVTPLENPGLGVYVDEDFVRAHPITEGPAWH